MSATDDQISAWLHGGLSDAESQRIAALLASDPQAARRAEELRRLDDLVRAAVPLEPALPAELMERLGLNAPDAEMGNVVDLSAARAARAAVAPVAIAAASRFAAGGLWRIAAQVVIVLGIGVAAASWIGMPGQSEPKAEYRALSDAPAGDTSANALVMFSADTDNAEAAAIARRAGARIIGNPTASGAWRLAVDPARRDEILDRLRAIPGVALAEPIDGAVQ